MFLDKKKNFADQLISHFNNTFENKNKAISFCHARAIQATNIVGKRCLGRQYKSSEGKNETAPTVQLQIPISLLQNSEIGDMYGCAAQSNGRITLQFAVEKNTPKHN